MKTAIVFCDPISSRTSVQLGLLNMVIKLLEDKYTLRVISPYIPATFSEKLGGSSISSFLSLSLKKPLLNAVYRAVERNEAMLWSFSWLFEVLFSANSSCIDLKSISGEDIIVVNLAYTVPSIADIYWNQATPPLITLQLMNSNPFAKVLSKVMGPFVELLDKKLRVKLKNNSKIIVNNSQYLKELHRGRELYSEEVIHVPKDFGEVEIPTTAPTRSYVLAYIGKEVEIETLLKLAENGIRVIAFGSKIPFGTPIAKLKDKMDFRGYVSEPELSNLYFNALFTAFPFTEEPFGWVPLESMFHGTPVLSYNKQGPSETIVNDKTGWLVNDKSEFLEKAIDIWSKMETNISESDCKERAKFFSFDRAGEELNKIIDGK